MLKTFFALWENSVWAASGSFDVRSSQACTLSRFLRRVLTLKPVRGRQAEIPAGGSLRGMPSGLVDSISLEPVEVQQVHGPRSLVVLHLWRHLRNLGKEQVAWVVRVLMCWSQRGYVGDERGSDEKIQYRWLQI